MPDPLRTTARVIRLGLTGHLRQPGLRFLGIAGTLGALALAWSRGDTAATTALLLTVWLGRAYGCAACLWFGYSAIRDLNDREGAVIRSKPVDGAWWVMCLWITGLLTWLSLLGLAFLGAAVGQLPHAGLGSLLAHGLGFCRAALVVISISTLGFALSRMMRSPLGGIMTVFAWFCAMAGLALIPAYLQPDFSQNRGLYLGAAALVLALAALVVERVRRGEFRRPLVPVLGLIVLSLLTAGGAAQAVRRAPALDGSSRSLWGRIALQHIEPGQRVPGFWLPDGKGGLLRTADHEGKILFIFLFDPGDVEAGRTLPALDTLARELGPRGVQPLGVCISRDQGDGTALVRTGGYGFPIGSDLSTLKSTPPPESATTLAYDAQVLPVLVVTDRRRLVRLVRTDASYSLDELRRLAEERLAEEPE